MAETEEEKDEVYQVPDNYTNSGRILQGMLEMRNVAEAAIVGALLGFIEYIFLINADPIKMAAIMIITIGPIVVACIVGINGDSFLQFLLAFINYLKNKRKLRYRRIQKNVKTTGSRAKIRPNNKKKTSRTSSNRS